MVKELIIEVCPECGMLRGRIPENNMLRNRKISSTCNSCLIGTMQKVEAYILQMSTPDLPSHTKIAFRMVES